MEEQEKKSFSIVLKDFIKECGDYASGLKIIWTVIGIISFFIAFYYEDVYLSYFNISLSEIDYDWKYFIYKAVCHFIIYSVLFVIYIYSEYSTIWAKDIKQWGKNLLLAFVLLTAISFLDFYIIYNDSFLSNLLAAVMLAAILLVLALIAALFSKIFINRETKIDSQEEKVQKKDNKQNYVIFISCLLAVVVILALVKNVAKDNAEKRNHFKVLLDEPNTIILYEDKNIFITCPYQQITKTKTTETKIVTEIIGDNSLIKEDIKTDVQELTSIKLYINEHNIIERNNHRTRMITVNKVEILRDEYLQSKKLDETSSDNL